MNRIAQSNKNLPAFTLIESVLYIAVLGLIAGVTVGAILFMYRAKTAVEDRVSLTNDMRSVISSIRNDMYSGDEFDITSNVLRIDSVRNGSTSITYFVDQDRVWRHVAGTDPIALTKVATQVTNWSLEDISTPSSAGVLRLHIALSNIPRATLKSQVETSTTSTISLKFL